MDELIEVGKKMVLEGEKLQQFVLEQQAIERRTTEGTGIDQDEAIEAEEQRRKVEQMEQEKRHEVEMKKLELEAKGKEATAA